MVHCSGRIGQAVRYRLCPRHHRLGWLTGGKKGELGTQNTQKEAYRSASNNVIHYIPAHYTSISCTHAYMGTVVATTSWTPTQIFAPGSLNFYIFIAVWYIFYVLHPMFSCIKQRLRNFFTVMTSDLWKISHDADSESRMILTDRSLCLLRIQHFLSLVSSPSLLLPRIPQSAPLGRRDFRISGFDVNKNPETQKSGNPEIGSILEKF